MSRMLGILAGAAAVGLTLAAVAPGSALALSTKECSVKYKAAKQAGTLGDKNWAQFRKAECGADAAGPTKPETKADKTEKPATPKLLGGGTAVFPKAVASKFASEKPHRQRLRTCLEQYNANKSSGGNGGLKWLQKGGGYYSECNKRLKG